MVTITADLFEFDVVSLFNITRDFRNGELHAMIQQRLAVFDGIDTSRVRCKIELQLNISIDLTLTKSL